MSLWSALASLIHAPPPPLVPPPPAPLPIALMFDEKAFFNLVRGPLFGGILTNEQVAGMTAITTAWRAWFPTADVRWLAYVLATAWWETGRKMQPVAEAGKGVGHAYGQPDPRTGLVYYGRGLIETTWYDNYSRLGDLLGIDLAHDPDLLLELPIAVLALIRPMVSGLYTGHRLADFFGPAIDDPFNARRVVNGLDRAETIAHAHAQFLTGLTA